MGVPRWDANAIPALQAIDWKGELGGKLAVVFVHTREEGPNGSVNVSEAFVLETLEGRWQVVHRIGLSIAR